MTRTANQVPQRLPQTRMPPSNDGRFLALLTALLVAAVWPFVGGFAALALVAGALAAVVMRWWLNRHPSAVADPNGRPRRSPEINFSAIPVGGDAAGLILVVGCVAIVMVGVPQLRTFMAAAVVVAGTLSALLIGWRKRHQLWTRATSSLRG